MESFDSIIREYIDFVNQGAKQRGRDVFFWLRDAMQSRPSRVSRYATTPHIISHLKTDEIKAARFPAPAPRLSATLQTAHV